MVEGLSLLSVSRQQPFLKTGAKKHSKYTLGGLFRVSVGWSTWDFPSIACVSIWAVPIAEAGFPNASDLLKYSETAHGMMSARDVNSLQWVMLPVCSIRLLLEKGFYLAQCATQAPQRDQTSLTACLVSLWTSLPQQSDQEWCLPMLWMLTGPWIWRAQYGKKQFLSPISLRSRTLFLCGPCEYLLLSSPSPSNTTSRACFPVVLVFTYISSLSLKLQDSFLAPSVWNA